VPQQLVDDDELPPGTGQIYPTVAAKDGSVIVGWQGLRDTAPGVDPLEEFAFVVGDVPKVPPASIAGWELY
jgi:hypothetical protein